MLKYIERYMMHRRSKPRRISTSVHLVPTDSLTADVESPPATANVHFPVC